MDRLKEIAKNLDSKDELSIYRNKFILPKNQVYLDGNSLGVLAKDVLDNVNYTIKEEWGNNLISSWNKSWIKLPRIISKKIELLRKFLSLFLKFKSTKSELREFNNLKQRAIMPQ